jgi:hypothetical protein
LPVDEVFPAAKNKIQSRGRKRASQRQKQLIYVAQCEIGDVQSHTMCLLLTHFTVTDADAVHSRRSQSPRLH